MNEVMPSMWVCTYNDSDTGEPFCVVLGGGCPGIYGSGRLREAKPGKSCTGGGWF